MAADLRPATAGDEAFLWDCLAWAAYEDGAEAARRVPYLQKWLEGWPRPGDFGVVAEADGVPVGGAWARQFPGGDPTTTIFVDDRTPEIAIGVHPARRAGGIGERLVDALVEMAQTRGCRGLCLTVRAENPAVRLYRRKGFDFVPNAERINRVGGVSYGMVLRF